MKIYKEQIIEINNQQEDEIFPTITFDKNIIRINQQDENSIDFVKNWIENPDDFTEYPIDIT